MRADRRPTLAATLFFLWISIPVPADPPGLKTLEIGKPAPDFDLPGVDGRRHRLQDFAAAKVLVVIFTCNHCPTAQAYEERLLKMHADYQDRGVGLVAISPNNAEALRLDELGYTDLGDSLEDMKIRAKDRGFKFPYLYDGDKQEAALAYGALATPHVFIFDAERKLRYNGRIDDAEVKEVKSPDARNAIDALLGGKPVPVEKTRVFGCSTKWIDKRESARKALEAWSREEAKLAPLDVAGARELSKNPSKKLRLINVWATWCGPCVAELPELVAMHRMYRQRDFELVTISLDEPSASEKALEVLKKHAASSTNYHFTGKERDLFMEALDREWPGPLPHTLLVEPGGKVIYRKTGQIDPREVRKAIADRLGRTY
jgi:peroxiredoxin